MNPSNGAPPLSLEEFKPVPCRACGELRRRTIAWQEHRVHRFNARMKITVDRLAWYCAGCRAQVDMDGLELAPEHPDRLPLLVLRNLQCEVTNG